MSAQSVPVYCLRLYWANAGLESGALFHTAPINCLAFSEDGRYLASGGNSNSYRATISTDLHYVADDGRVIVWHCASGNEHQTVLPGQGQVTGLQWTRSAQPSWAIYLITSGADGTIKLWKKRDAKVLFRFFSLFFFRHKDPRGTCPAIQECSPFLTVQ